MRLIAYLSQAIGELMKDETGVSLMEFALVGSLFLIVCMLLVLAWEKRA